MMHLEGPWLSTTGKKRGKVKYASAEAKRQAEQLAKDWQDLLKRQGATATGTRKKPQQAQGLSGSYSLAIPSGRDTTAHIKSRGASTGVAALPAPKVYTGTKVVGIVVQHKSCLQPVFSQEAAMDSAKMRR